MTGVNMVQFIVGLVLFAERTTKEKKKMNLYARELDEDHEETNYITPKIKKNIDQ